MPLVKAFLSSWLFGLAVSQSAGDFMAPIPKPREGRHDVQVQKYSVGVVRLPKAQD